MTRKFTRIVSLHTLASVGILVALLLVFAMLLFTPVISKFAEYQYEFARDARMLQRLLAIEAIQGDVDQTSEEFVRRDLAGWVYPSADAAEVQLDIQRRVTTTLGDAGATLSNTAPAPAAVVDGHQRVGVTVRFNGPLESVYGGIAALEQSKPLLLLDDLRIVPMPIRVRRGEPVPQHLDVQMAVYVLLPSDVGGAAR